MQSEDKGSHDKAMTMGILEASQTHGHALLLSILPKKPKHLIFCFVGILLFAMVFIPWPSTPDNSKEQRAADPQPNLEPEVLDVNQIPANDPKIVDKQRLSIENQQNINGDDEEHHKLSGLENGRKHNVAIIEINGPPQGANKGINQEEQKKIEIRTNGYRNDINDRRAVEKSGGNDDAKQIGHIPIPVNILKERLRGDQLTPAEINHMANKAQSIVRINEAVNGNNKENKDAVNNVGHIPIPVNILKERLRQSGPGGITQGSNFNQQLMNNNQGLLANGNNNDRKEENMGHIPIPVNILKERLHDSRPADASYVRNTNIPVNNENRNIQQNINNAYDNEKNMGHIPIPVNILKERLHEKENNFNNNNAYMADHNNIKESVGSKGEDLNEDTGGNRDNEAGNNVRNIPIPVDILKQRLQQNQGGYYNNQMKVPIGTNNYNNQKQVPLGVNYYNNQEKVPVGNIYSNNEMKVPLGNNYYNNQEKVPVGNIYNNNEMKVPLGNNYYNNQIKVPVGSNYYSNQKQVPLGVSKYNNQMKVPVGAKDGSNIKDPIGAGISNNIQEKIKQQDYFNRPIDVQDKIKQQGFINKAIDPPRKMPFGDLARPNSAYSPNNQIRRGIDSKYKNYQNNYNVRNQPGNGFGILNNAPKEGSQREYGNPYNSYIGNGVKEQTYINSNTNSYRVENNNGVPKENSFTMQKGRLNDPYMKRQIDPFANNNKGNSNDRPGKEGSSASPWNMHRKAFPVNQDILNAPKQNGEWRNEPQNRNLNLPKWQIASHSSNPWDGKHIKKRTVN